MHFAIISQLFKVIALAKCVNYPGIKLEPVLQSYENKLGHLSSYDHVIQTIAKQIISRHGKNWDICEMNKNENCMCKACKSIVLHRQICKCLTFLLSWSWCLLNPFPAVSANWHLHRFYSV